MRDWPIPGEKEPSRLAMAVEFTIAGSLVLYGWGSMIYGGIQWLTSLL